jgi:hypothetical protein
MPPRIPWITGVDRLILDWMYANDVVIKPKLLLANLERDYSPEEAPSYSQMVRRCRFLRERAGLLEHFSEDYSGELVLSDLGRRFQEDELTEDERKALLLAGDLE